MTVEEQVRGAKTPGESLLILARAIDMLRNSRPPTDDWTIPPAHSTPAEVREWEEAVEEAREWNEAQARATYNEKLKLLGDQPSDPEDAQAWEARRRLLRDELLPPTPDVGVEHTVLQKIPLGKDSLEMVVPVADELTQARRVAFASTMGLDRPGWWTTPNLALEPGVAINAYAKGGPLWLAAYDRKFVMGLPAEMRRQMVEDVATFSQDDAQAFGRDVLKDTTPDGGREVALQAQAAAQKIAPPELG